MQGPVPLYLWVKRMLLVVRLQTCPFPSFAPQLEMMLCEGVTWWIYVGTFEIGETSWRN
jgi:hypothetical protein